MALLLDKFSDNANLGANVGKLWGSCGEAKVLDIFDTHTHLDSKEFETDREQVIERARAAGVTRLLTVGASDGFSSAERAIALAEKYDFIWASAGIHPHDAAVEFDLARLKMLALHARVVAVGEIGLDFFRDWAPREAQYKWFEAQIGMALEINKPIIIHSRAAGSESLALLKQNGAHKVGGVFHCYSEDAKFAEELHQINFLVSVPGSLTFKKAEALREIIKAIPLDQIMLETDAPYMAPEPHRGKRCESAFTVETAKMLASIKGLPLDEVCQRTTENALRLFRIAA